MRRLCLALALASLPAAIAAQNTVANDRLNLDLYWEYETVSDPQLSPDGAQIIYTRGWIDKINDKRESSLWIMNADGGRNRFLTRGSAARWSPNGDRIVYTAQGDPKGSQIFVRYMDAEGATSQITHVTESPANVTWAPDGQSIAFAMKVEKKNLWSIKMPERPEGAKWTETPRIVERLDYRQDGQGLNDDGYRHLFTVPATGGTPRQLTNGDWDHNGIEWTPDGKQILFTSLRVPDADYEFRESEIYSVNVDTGAIAQLTRRKGPDNNPRVSPDGKLVAYTGIDSSRNTWTDNDGEPRVQFHLRTSAGDSRWGFGVRLRELVGLPSSALSNTATDVQFSWTREAGMFRFTGSFDQGRGSGTYTFTQDQTFVTNMAGAGYRNLSTDDIVRMAMVDVTVAHARGLAQAGYANLPVDDLVRSRIHRVTPQFVSDLAGVGYKNIPLEDLIRMSIHGATAANIKALQDAGIRGQSVEDVIRFRIHKVTPEFIRAMEQRGYKNVMAEDLVRMRIHKVTPEEIDRLRAAGFANMSVEELVRFRIHKVTPEFVDELKALGFTGLAAEELVRFRIHKVTPEYIRSMREVGFQSATEDQLVRMRIHKVDALFVRHAREDGLTLQTPGEAIDLAIHGPRWKRRR